MIVKDITQLLEDYAPLAYQEDYDNAGLLVGNFNQKINKVLICLDCTEAVIDEAIKENCDLIIAHHPIIFKGIKKLNGKNYVERVIIKAIENKIALYAIHTNLDNVINGVNGKICNKLSLINRKILSPKKQNLKKLVTFIPVNNAEDVKEAIFNAGAGNIGNYSNCSFNTLGNGTFKANKNTNPFVGEQDKLHTEEELKVEVIFDVAQQSKILNALLKSHPYEEVAFDIFPLENKNPQVGSGMFGELVDEMEEIEFLQNLKKVMNVSVIRHSNLLNKKIKKVAVCGGSGSFLLKDAIQAGADIFITSDFKYHEFFDADEKLLIADIGHYESEQFTQDLLLEIITENFPNFAIRLTENNTNPIKYLS
jgi:dinuclear metal center YbgI/SA1388 family protein